MHIGDIILKSDDKKNSARASRRTEERGPGKSVAMPDIYVDGKAEEVTSPEDVTGDAEFLGIDTSRGFDPYDTGVLYKK